MFIKKLVVVPLAILLLTFSVSIADDLDDAVAAYEKGDYQTAIRILKPLAEQGDAAAQYHLGFVFELGLFDDAQAKRWYRAAAEQGHVRAQWQLGFMYEMGWGEPPDYNQAVKWYRLAAEQGDTSAQNSLAHIYLNGEGLPVDNERAVKWLRLAAEQGDAGSKEVLGIIYAKGERLGLMYDYGKDYPEDDKEAAEQGDARAQYKLGLMYDLGKGVLEDDKEAVKWYGLAAEQGDSDAQNNLGILYNLGEGVIINYTDAVRLFEESARQDNKYGMYNLAVMYGEGKGVEQDNIYAYMWFNLAYEAGVKSAKEQRKELSEKMTTKELRIAQELSLKCLDSDYKKCESALPNFLHRKFNLSSEDKDS